MDYETNVRSLSSRIANEIYDYPANKEPASDLIFWVVNENKKNDRVEHTEIITNLDIDRTKVDKILNDLYEEDVFQPAPNAMTKALVVPSLDGLKMVLNSGDLDGDDEETNDPEELFTNGGSDDDEDDNPRDADWI